MIRAEHVVEQRLSNLGQGLLTLATMTPPLLEVLHLVPHGVLAGLFFVMGVQALEANGITAKLVFLARDAALTPRGHPLRRVARRSRLWLFVGIELLAFGATFAITQTVAAVGFPVFIMLLIPVRAVVLPRWFSAEDLGLLDGPTASPFTMESVGGQHGGSSSTDEEYGSAAVVGEVPPPLRPSVSGSRRPGHGEAIFALPGGPRLSQDDVQEFGELRTGGMAGTATRRRSSAATGVEIAEFRALAQTHSRGSSGRKR